MANITEKIAKQFTAASVEEGNIPLITIDDANWHELARMLRDDADRCFVASMTNWQNLNTS